MDYSQLIQLSRDILLLTNESYSKIITKYSEELSKASPGTISFQKLRVKLVDSINLGVYSNWGGTSYDEWYDEILMLITSRIHKWIMFRSNSLALSKLVYFIIHGRNNITEITLKLTKVHHLFSSPSVIFYKRLKSELETLLNVHADIYKVERKKLVNALVHIRLQQMNSFPPVEDLSRKLGRVIELEDRGSFFKHFKVSNLLPGAKKEKFLILEVQKKLDSSPGLLIKAQCADLEADDSVEKIKSLLKLDLDGLKPLRIESFVKGEINTFVFECETKEEMENLFNEIMARQSVLLHLKKFKIFKGNELEPPKVVLPEVKDDFYHFGGFLSVSRNMPQKIDKYLKELHKCFAKNLAPIVAEEKILRDVISRLMEIYDQRELGMFQDFKDTYFEQYVYSGLVCEIQEYLKGKRSYRFEFKVFLEKVQIFSLFLSENGFNKELRKLDGKKNEYKFLKKLIKYVYNKFFYGLGNNSNNQAWLSFEDYITKNFRQEKVKKAKHIGSKIKRNVRMFFSDDVEKFEKFEKLLKNMAVDVGNYTDYICFIIMILTNILNENFYFKFPTPFVFVLSEHCKFGDKIPKAIVQYETHERNMYYILYESGNVSINYTPITEPKYEFKFKYPDQSQKIKYRLKFRDIPYTVDNFDIFQDELYKELIFFCKKLPPKSNINISKQSNDRKISEVSMQFDNLDAGNPDSIAIASEIEMCLEVHRKSVLSHMKSFNISDPNTPPSKFPKRERPPPNHKIWTAELMKYCYISETLIGHLLENEMKKICETEEARNVMANSDTDEKRITALTDHILGNYIPVNFIQEAESANSFETLLHAMIIKNRTEGNDFLNAPLIRIFFNSPTQLLKRGKVDNGCTYVHSQNNLNTMFGVMPHNKDSLTDFVFYLMLLFIPSILFIIALFTKSEICFIVLLASVPLISFGHTLRRCYMKHDIIPSRDKRIYIKSHGDNAEEKIYLTDEEIVNRKKIFWNEFFTSVLTVMIIYLLIGLFFVVHNLLVQKGIISRNWMHTITTATS